MALDPSYFFKCLTKIIIKAGNLAFDLFSQQDAVEVLSYILEELCGESIHSGEFIRVHSRQTIFWTACKKYTSTDNSYSIPQLPVAESIKSSLNTYLKSHLLSGENEFFCNFCSFNNEALSGQETSKVDDNLIIQVKQFLEFGQETTKYVRKISYSPILTLPVTLDEDIVCNKKLS